MRGLVRETDLLARHLIQPVFVREGEGACEPIESMPGQHRWPVDRLAEFADDVHRLGLGGVIVFGLPASKDASGRGAYDDDGIAQRAVRELKRACPDLVVVADVCLCEYTDHGHCGVIEDEDVDNDATLPLLARTTTSLATAGADIVAPSAMMDGQVAAIRGALDLEGYADTAIMAYAAKYASAFYGPFREAAASTPRFGDRRSYQMDPANAREALLEIASDLDEGADIVMVKPALPCLDIVRLARDTFDEPVAAYQVSGEYAMIRAAAERGWIDGEAVLLESLTAIARAGADIVITYHAREAARWLS